MGAINLHSLMRIRLRSRESKNIMESQIKENGGFRGLLHLPSSPVNPCSPSKWNPALVSAEQTQVRQSRLCSEARFTRGYKPQLSETCSADQSGKVSAVTGSEEILTIVLGVRSIDGMHTVLVETFKRFRAPDSRRDVRTSSSTSEDCHLAASSNVPTCQRPPSPNQTLCQNRLQLCWQRLDGFAQCIWKLESKSRHFVDVEG